MGSLITTRDLHENPEFSVQQTHSLDVESILPTQEHTKGNNELIWIDSEQTIVIIFQTILLILFCVFGTLTNSLVFWVFNRRPALRSLSNRFVLSLVTANILISSIIAPLMLFESILNEYFLLSCITEVISMISSSVIFAAIFSTFLIATDRFYAVTSPLHYSMTITRSRSQVMIVVAWLAGILLALPYIIICSLPPNSELHQSLHVLFIIVQLAVGYLLPFFGLCWLYLRMYHAAHRNSERTRKHSISGELLTVMDGSTSVIPPQGIDFLTHYMNPFTKAPMAGSVQPVSIGGTSGAGESRNGNCNHGGTSIGQIVPAAVKKQRRRSSNGSSSSLLFREEGRAIKTAFLVLASFLLCWTPHFAFMLMSEIDIVQNHFGHLVTVGRNLSTATTHTLPNHYSLSTTSPSTMPSPVHVHPAFSFGSDWVRFLGLFGILLSCLLNPFIYVFRNKMACKEVSKLLCRFFREKRRQAKQDAAARERHQHLLHHDRDQNDISNRAIMNDADDSGTVLADYPKYSPCIGKSPKRSSLKSLTPQSSLNSTTTNSNSITNVNSPISGENSRICTATITKPPFMRSMTVPEQTQPRVKFPPNLIRQKSCIHRPIYGCTSELTPALSKRPKFVRQDSICSILSNDSVLMICADDGLSMSESGLLNRSGGNMDNGCINGGCTTGGQVANGSMTSGCGAGGSSNLSTGGGTPLQKHYLRQDSNFSDSSHKTNDSGIVLSTCPSEKHSTTTSPCIHSNHCCRSSRNQSPSHLSITNLSPKRHLSTSESIHKQNHYPILQTTI